MTEDLSRRVAAELVAEVGARPGLAAALDSLLGLLEETEPGARLYACGGLVRDLVVAQTRDAPVVVKDFDLVVAGLSGSRLGEVLRAVRERCRAVRWVERVGASFPVLKARVAGLEEPVDLAVVRTRSSFGVGRDSYVGDSPGLTVEDDARHRDFTMNALYVELWRASGGALAGRVRDLHQGLAAIVAGEIRCVGDPAERFAEDPLRMLRAVRFACCLPGFEIAPATAAAIRTRAKGWLDTLARDRLADELYRALAADPERALDLLARLDMLAEICPDLVALGGEAVVRAARRVDALARHLGAPPRPPFLFGALLLDLARPGSLPPPPFDHSRLSSRRVARLARDLRLPDVRRLSRACSVIQVLRHLDRVNYPDAVLEDLLAGSADRAEVLALDRAAAETSGLVAEDLAARLERYPPTELDFGRMVERAGLPAGPRLGRLRLALRQAEIEGRVSGEAQALAFLDCRGRAADGGGE